MFSRATAISIVLLCMASPVLAQHTEILSPQRSQAYKQNSLSVNLSGIQLTDESGGLLGVGCSTCWTSYQGYERLSEASFFKVAGYDQLAKQAQRSRRNKFIAIGLGAVSMAAGAAILSNNFSKAKAGNAQAGPGFIGVALIGGGGASIGFSAMKLQTRSVPYEVARDVAGEYNARLMEDIGQR